MSLPRGAKCLLPLLGLALSGCGERLDTSYGRMRSSSVNGTGAFAALLRERGHETRTYSRLGTRIEDWADAIVRFASTPGAPDKEEAEWYDHWLNSAPGRAVIYVPRDFDATHEYWSRALDELPRDAAPRLVERVTEAKDKSANWAKQLAPHATKHADPESWFATEDAQGGGGTVTVCSKLEGPWAAGLDATKVAIPRHETLKLETERLLLSGDGKPLVMDWVSHTESRVLAVANGAFLLNEPMTRRERAVLAGKVANWLDSKGESFTNDGTSRPPTGRHIAFVEGRFVTVDKRVVTDKDYRLEIQLGLLGLAACLAVAPRLGRPRPEPPSGADRPVAHAEALGALLARTGKASEARSLLENYRRWRFGPGAAGRGGPPHASQ